MMMSDMSSDVLQSLSPEIAIVASSSSPSIVGQVALGCSSAMVLVCTEAVARRFLWRVMQSTKLDEPRQ